MLKELRQRRGMTQADVAKALGYTTPQYISNVERGRCTLSVKQFPKVAKLLDVPVTKLINARVKQFEAQLRRQCRV